MTSNKSFGILGILIAIGLIGAGYQVSNTLYKAKMSTNTVTVRGFSEKDVKADLVMGQIIFSTTGDELNSSYEKMASDSKIVSEYLIKNGIKINDIKIGNISVIDNFANQYRTKEAEKGTRYTLKGYVSVHSNDIDTVEKSIQKIGTLVKEGIVLEGNQFKYKFTKLSEIKPEMLRDATKNARDAAEQFANDAGSKVGAIQSATQGFFSIGERDSSTNGDANNEDYSQTSGIDKKVRVVTTITYYLDK